MIAVMDSVSPEECVKIMRGDKKADERKKNLKIEAPFKVYIYCTATPKYYRVHDFNKYKKYSDSGVYYVPDGYLNGKVIGEYVCDMVECFVVGSLRSDEIQELLCKDYYGLINYYYNKPEDFGKVKFGYIKHITNLKIYDKPKELSEFQKPNGEPLVRPFQGFGYVKDLEDN